MKYSALNLAAIMVVAFLSSCDHEEKSDVEKFCLVGKVKSVTAIEYNAFDKFGEGNLQKDKPEYQSARITSFDSIGNIVSDKTIFISEVNERPEFVSLAQDLRGISINYKGNDENEMDLDTEFFFDEKGSLIKYCYIDNGVNLFEETNDDKGRLISQIGDKYKRYWEYDNNELVKFTEYYLDHKTEYFYEGGLLVKDVRTPSVYWTHQYDNQRRSIEDVMYKDDAVCRKFKNVYSKPTDTAPVEKIEWNEDGVIVHDYTYTYFTVGGDTVSIFRYDKDKLYLVEFYSKDSKGKTEVDYEIKSNVALNLQYVYADGKLVSLRDVEDGKDYKYIDDVATIKTEDGDEVTEIKIKRNTVISRIVKNKVGTIIYSFTVDGNDSKKTFAFSENGEERKEDEFYENGKVVKYTEANGSITNTLSYNDAGYVSEIKSTDGTVLTHKYDYDSHGNWVRDIVYKNGQPEKICERSITYYE